MANVAFSWRDITNELALTHNQRNTRTQREQSWQPAVGKALEQVKAREVARATASNKFHSTIMPTILEKRTKEKTLSFKPKFISNGRMKEEQEIHKWQNLPPVRNVLLRLAKNKDYAKMLMDYNKFIGANGNPAH